MTIKEKKENLCRRVEFDGKEASGKSQKIPTAEVNSAQKKILSRFLGKFGSPVTLAQLDVDANIVTISGFFFFSSSVAFFLIALVYAI